MHTWIRSERASCTKSLHGNPRSVSPRNTPPLSLFDFGLLAQGKKKHEDCHNHKHNMTMPIAQQYVNMTVYPKTLSFCYPVKHLDAVEKVKKDFVECNYVEMPNKKLKHVRDFLENWTAQK